MLILLTSAGTDRGISAKAATAQNSLPTIVVIDTLRHLPPPLITGSSRFVQIQPSSQPLSLQFSSTHIAASRRSCQHSLITSYPAHHPVCMCKVVSQPPLSPSRDEPPCALSSSHSGSDSTTHSTPLACSCALRLSLLSASLNTCGSQHSLPS